MSVAGNKALVRRLWEEVWDRGDVAVADEIFDPAYAAHEKGFVTVWRTAFPDTRLTVEDIFAEGDRVVTRFVVRGTHRGEFQGMAPTGRTVTLSGIWIHRVSGGRIVEGRDWGVGDWLGLMRQLGTFPGA